MTLPEECFRLRIHCAEDDKHGSVPVFEAIVRRAHELGLAGATVLRGSMGYSAGSDIHTARVLRLAEGLPIVIDIVESREQIDALLPYVREVLRGGVATLEPVQVVVSGKKRPEG